jgi:Flp pilus assembly protein TadD
MRTFVIAMLVSTPLLLGGCSMFRGGDVRDPGPNGSDEMRSMHLSMIRALSDSGKVQAALAFLDDYEIRFPEDREARALRAEALLRVGRREESQVMFRKLLEEDYRPAADFGLGQVHAAYRDWHAASKYFGEAARRAPTNVRYLNNYGYALMKIDDAKAAYNVLARAYQLKPNDERTRNNFILAATHSGHQADANKALGTIDTNDRESVTAFVQGWSP